MANVLTAGAGFLLASHWHGKWGLFVATMAGMSLLVASACVLNNYFDRDLDTKMPRTKRRALAIGSIPARNAVIFGAILGIAGFVTLAMYVTWLVVTLGAIAYFDYIVLYAITKRRTVHGTLVGTVSGASPMAAGYCAAAGHIDSGAGVLFLAMTFWQMPHFFAIAIYRMRDYAAGHIPVMPLKKGVHSTKVQIVVYAILFLIAALSLSVFGYTGSISAVVMAAAGLAWLYKGVRGFRTAKDEVWARGMFVFSLKVLLIFIAMVAIGGVLP